MSDGSKVLLINSDLAKNRGDRAIAEGVIQIIQECLPGATICGISQARVRDEAWYGANFINMNFQSLNPLDLVKLLRVARSADVVLWGGGEILKDYTNKAALWYWCLKMGLVTLVNKNTYGVYQGIGPTKSKSSRVLIRSVVQRTRAFIVRDSESAEKLISWGVDADKVISASDPAVLPSPDRPSPELVGRITNEVGLSPGFFGDFICVAPREWFHYRRGGFLPFKYRQKMAALFSNGTSQIAPEAEMYVKRVAELVSAVSKRYDTNILLVPMHMEEGDAALCTKAAAGEPAQGKSIRVLAEDSLSPAELRSVIGEARAMIGFRLHSNIIGVSSGTPSLNIYYVDKGRVFFDQIQQQKYAIPIETIISDDYSEVVLTKLDDLLTREVEVRRELHQSTQRLRGLVRDAARVFNA